MPDKKGLYLEVAGDVDKKLLKDLESLENRLKSLLQGISGKFDNKQFKRVQDQIKTLFDFIASLQTKINSTSNTLKKALEGSEVSLNDLRNALDPDFRFRGTVKDLDLYKEELQGLHSSVKKILPDFEKLLTLYSSFGGGPTSNITKKFNALEEDLKDLSNAAIEMEETSKGVFSTVKGQKGTKYSPAVPEMGLKKKDITLVEDLGKEVSKGNDAITEYSDTVTDFQDKLHELMGTVMEFNAKLKEGVDEIEDGEEAAKAYGKALKKLLEQYEKYKKRFEKSKQFKQAPGLGTVLDYIKSQYDEAIEKVDQLKDRVRDLGASVEKTLKDVGSVGTEAGSILDEKMLYQDLLAAPEDTYFDYLEGSHKALKALIKALKEKRDAQGEIQDAYEEIKDAASDAAAVEGPVSEQLLELLGRWKEKLGNVEDAIRKVGQGLEGQAEKEGKVAEAVEKAGETEEQSLEAKKKQAKEIGEALDGEEEKREKLSKKTQEYEEKTAKKVEEVGKREVIVRKKAAKATEDAGRKERESRKKTTEAAKDSAEEIVKAEKEVTDAIKESVDKIEDIAKEQKEKIAEPKIADVDFSEAEEKFNAFTDKVQQGVTDLSNSIKRIFDELGGLIQEGVRTIEIAVTPKGFDETIGKQGELDKALSGSAKTAEDVSQREQQAFLNSAVAFIQASDVIKEHQKEVDEALKKSGDIAEDVSEQEKRAFSGIGGTPGKIETPEAESGILDLMAQLLIQVTKNLDLMSQRMEATREEMKNFNKEMGDTTSSLDDMASSSKKTKKEGIIDSDEIKHLKLFEQIAASLQDTLGDSQEEISGYTRRAKEMSEQVVKLGITLKELGMLETEEGFQEWINSIDTFKLVLADNLNALERTKKGFRAFTEEGKEALKLDEDMVSILKLLDTSLTSYAKRLYDLQTKSEAGDDESRELLKSLEKIASIVGTSEQSFKRYNEILINIQQHFKDLKGQSDESVGAMIDDIDQAAVALEAYRGNVKVTKSSMEALNDEGFEPFSGLGEDLAKELKVTGKAFQKFRKDSEQISHLEAYNYVFKELTENMDDSRESFKGAEERAKKVADQIVKLGITLRELGVLESKKDFEKWLEGIDVVNIALAEHSEFLKETKKGYRAAQPAGEEFLNLNEDMKNALAASEKSVTLYEERLYELEKSYTAGNKEALEQISILKELGAKIGTNDEAFKKYDKILTQVTQHFRDLERRSDGATEQVIKGVDKANVAFEAYEGNIKVTKDALEVLNGDGYEPFLELNEDVARDLDIIGNKFDKARESTSEYKEAMRKAAEENDSHAQALKKLSEQYGDSEFHIAAYNKIIREAKKYISEVTAVLSYEISELERKIRTEEAAGRATDKLNDELEEKKRQLQEVTQTTSLAEVAMDEFKNELEGTKKGFQKFDKYIKDSVHELGFLGDAFSMVGKRIKQFAAFALAAAAVQQITEGIRVFIEVMSDYDQALHNLMAILEVTTSRVAVLGDQIQKVAQDTKFSSTEVAEAVQILGQAGLTIEEVGIALSGVTRLATGTLSEIADVADLTTTALNSFRLEAVETTRTSDIFANAINNSKLNVDKLKTAFNYVGAAGKQIGLSLNELTGTLMVLADNGIRASTMGTGLRRMMLKMLDPTTEFKAEIEALNMSVDDFNPKIVGWENAVKSLIPILWDAERQSLDMAKTVDYFGTRAAQVAAIVVRSVADGSEAIAKATEKTYEYGAAQTMAEKQQRGLALAIKNLEDRLKNLAIAIGEKGITGLVKDVIDALRLMTEVTYETIKSTNNFWTDLIGWASAAGIAAFSFAGLNKILLKVKKSARALGAAFSFVTKAWLAVVGYITAGIVLFDRLVSYQNEAAKAAAKHSQELSLAATAMKNWGDTIEKAFATREWENTIKRFREETKNTGGEVANLADKVEKKLGHAIEAISGPSGLQRFHKAWEEVRLEEVSESIDSVVDSLENTSGSIASLQSWGVDFGQELDATMTPLTKFSHHVYEAVFNTLGLVAAGEQVRKGWEGVIDLFGPDKQELITQFNENINDAVKRINQLAKIKEWGTDEIINYMDMLGEEIGKNTHRWIELRDKMAKTTFAPLISAINDISYERRKEMVLLKEEIKLMEESGQSTKGLNAELKILEKSYKDQEETFKKFKEGLQSVIDKEKSLKVVMLELKDSGQITEENFKRVASAMEREVAKATDSSIMNFDLMRKKFEDIGHGVQEMYRNLDPTDKMSFDKFFGELDEEVEELKTYLEDLPDKYKWSQNKINRYLEEYREKRIREELKSLLGIGDMVEDYTERYEKIFEGLNSKISSIYNNRRDIVNRHYDWELNKIENSEREKEDILDKTVQLEDDRRRKLLDILDKEYSEKINATKRHGQELEDLYWDDEEKRKEAVENTNEKVEDLEKELSQEREKILDGWLDTLQNSYDEAISISEKYTDKIKDLEEEIDEARKERADNLRDIERNLADDLYDIRKAGMTDMDAVMSDFSRANEMYKEAQDLIDAGKFERAKDLLSDSAGMYKDIAVGAKEAKKEGEDYAVSSSSAIAGLKNAYESLEEAEKKQKSKEIADLQSQIDSFEQLKRQVDATAEKYRNMANDILSKMNEMDEKQIADKKYKIVSNVQSEIFKVQELVRDLKDLSGSVISYTVKKVTENVEKKASGGLVGAVNKFAGGGSVPGTGSMDNVKALLTPGEYVIPKAIVSKLGSGFFDSLISNDKFARKPQTPSPAPVYSDGGLVSGKESMTATLNLQVGDKTFKTKTTDSILKDITKELRRKGLAI